MSTGDIPLPAGRQNGHSPAILLKDILDRIDARLNKLGLSDRAAALASGKSEDLIRDMRRGLEGKKGGVKGAKVESLLALAPVLQTTLNWLATGEGPEDNAEVLPPSTSVPIISWVQAGAPNLAELTEDADRIHLAGIPAGDWVAFRVEGDSMDRISPPGSVVVVNRRERQLFPNACYVVTDDDFAGTYKRFRPATDRSPARLEPVSTNPSHEPIFLQPGYEPRVIGRVRYSLLEM